MVPIARKTSSLRSTSTCRRAIVAPVAQSVAASATTVVRPTAETLPSSMACSEPLTDLLRSVVRHRDRGIPAHQLQRRADAFVRHEIERRRLRQVDRHRFAQRAVEVGIGRAVGDLADQHRAALCPRGRPPAARPPGDADRCSDHEDDAATIAVVIRERRD